MTTLRFKKMHPLATAPSFGTADAAGLDICASETTVIPPYEAALIPTGIAVEIPSGHMGLLALRSGTPRKKGLFSPHGMGIIDADFRGELMVQVCTFKPESVTIEAGERIAQLVILPARSLIDSNTGTLSTLQGTEEVETLSETVRGAGGFGSSGA